MNPIVYQDGDKQVWITDFGDYVISYGSWMPGAYETIDAATIALEMDDEVLKALQESVNPGGVITEEMLKPWQ